MKPKSHLLGVNLMRLKKRLIFVPIACVSVVIVVAQQPPPPRVHTVTKKQKLSLLPANSSSDQANRVSVEIEGSQRVIRSNGIPKHKTGSFPNAGNPNRIREQDHVYRVPADPQAADQTTPIQGEFGVAINGVPFDPGAGEFFDGEPGWQYEPLSGAIALGIDVSHAHVQPNGKYHYHGLPTGLLDSVKLDPNKHSPLIGWAADGFPIYAVYGYEEPKADGSAIKALRSSYQLKQGNRPGGNAPDGEYDGTFVRDYEFVAGSGDLDECNGRHTITPEFPDGTYAYFLTEQWPVIPRVWRGTPSDDFQHRGAMNPRNRVAGIQGQPPRNRDRMGQRPIGPDRFGPPEFGRPGFGGPEGQGQFGGPPRPGQILPNFMKQSLRLNTEQQEKIERLQKLVDEELREILTPQQMQQLNRMGPASDRLPPDRRPPF